VVVGAGPSGLGCALGLHRLGATVTVCDRDPDVVHRGAAIGLWWNGIDALRQLGLDRPLLADHVVVRRAAYRNATGELLMAVPAEDFFPGAPVPFAAVAREHLQRVLLGALADAGAPAPRLGIRVSGLTDRGEQTAVRLSDGTELDADLVVGADGLRSRVRQLAFPASRVRDTGLAGWTGIAHLDRPADAGRQLAGLADAFQHLAGTDGAVFFAPSRPGRVFWGTIARAAPVGFPRPAREAALDRFRGWWPPVLELIEATPATGIVAFRVHDLRPVRRWVRGRVALVGDAAHAMVPHLAQGACQALEDAVALRDCLAAAGSVPAALAAYQARRGRPGRRVAGASRLYARTLPVQDPLLRMLAGSGVRSRARRRVLSRVERLMAPGHR
jgi:2-polyprenyl-6-methoxyphenol hydroxylase-like FAD-dependent oxidoreductase